MSSAIKNIKLKFGSLSFCSCGFKEENKFFSFRASFSRIIIIFFKTNLGTKKSMQLNFSPTSVSLMSIMNTFFSLPILMSSVIKNIQLNNWQFQLFAVLISGKKTSTSRTAYTTLHYIITYA
jgi:hypothetical protein